MIERRAPRRVERVGIARDFRGAADADAVAQPCDRDLVALVHHGGYRRTVGIADGHRDRITLHRIDRNGNADRLQHPRRPASERRDIGIGLQQSRAGDDAGDLAAFRLQPLDAGVELELHAELCCFFGERLRKHVAVAGLVLRQPKPADELDRRRGEPGLRGNAAGRIEHFVGHAILFEHRDIVAGAVELLLLAKQLQRALAALVIFDAGLGAQRAQAVAAVFGDRNHPALVDGVALCRAVAQQLQHPPPHHGIELGPDHQRPVPHQQPFDGFHRHAGAGPGRGIAGRHLAGIGERSFLRGLGLAVDDRHLMAGARQIIGRGDADDATAENNDFHDPSRIRRGIVPRLLLLMRARIRPRA